MEIIEEVGKGRTALARCNSGVGIIISVDDSIGVYLSPDDPPRCMQYWLQCMQNVTVSYPCSGCPRVVFCSRECQQIAEGERINEKSWAVLVSNSLFEFLKVFKDLINFGW